MEKIQKGLSPLMKLAKKILPGSGGGKKDAWGYRVRAYVDDCVFSGEDLFIRGWIFEEHHEIDRLEVLIRGKDQEKTLAVDHLRLPREDVRAALGNQAAYRSGFVEKQPIGKVAGENPAILLRYTIEGKSGEIPVKNVRRAAAQAPQTESADAFPTEMSGDAETLAWLKDWTQREGKEGILTFSHLLGGGADTYLRQRQAEWREAGKSVCAIYFDGEAGNYLIRISGAAEETELRNGEAGGTELRNEAAEGTELRSGAAEETELRLGSLAGLPEIFLDCGLSEIWVNELVSYPALFATLRLILRLKEATGAKLVFPLHDYFAISPDLNLISPLDDDYAFDGKEFHCDRFFVEEGHPVRFGCPGIREWRNRWGGFLSECDEIRTFSPFCEGLLRAVYPELKNITVTPHRAEELPPVERIPKTTGTLNIGILGVLSNHKGRLVARDLVEYLEARQENAKVILIGEEDGQDPMPEGAHFSKTGRYAVKELPDLVRRHEIDLIWIPSICPETFSFTTEEAMEMKMPTACFNLGAPAERVSKYEKGLILSSRDPETILAEIRNYLSVAS